MGTNEVRKRYLDFFKARGHSIIPSAPLLPEDDPTTLFTGSGMQPMLQYLLGEPHPLGTRIADSQKCFRTVDIEEIGDNRHTTLFEMLGNWSLGDYFKKQQLEWAWKFYVEEIGLPPERMYASVFRGYKDIPKDKEAVEILRTIFAGYGLDTQAVDNAKAEGMRNGRIFYYDVKENWWSRVGPPEEMPAGEPGGPTSEVFFDFGAELRIHENSAYSKSPCHPACSCGRFLEIGNSVFMTYEKQDDGSLQELPRKNIDFGGGLERIVAAIEETPDIFTIDSFSALIRTIEETSGFSYEGGNKPQMRIIADHLKGATFLISDGVRPSNKGQGYYLRRLLRRAAISFYSLTGDMTPAEEIKEIAHQVIGFYGDLYFDRESDRQIVSRIIVEELERFNKALKRGLKEIESTDLKRIDGEFVFDLYQSFGLPYEVTREVLANKGQSVSRRDFDKAFEEHQQASRKSAEKKFRGGLADTQEDTVKLHTATHLLHQALRDVLGEHVRQEGSNITAERLRFDFMHPDSLSAEEKQQVEELINRKIDENLSVWSKVMEKDKALERGALAFFREKYADRVKIYCIGGNGDMDSAYSKELCGGPHVDSTGELGKFKIVKEESAGAGTRRIYAKLE